jgi:hypothetical protein
MCQHFTIAKIVKQEDWLTEEDNLREEKSEIISERMGKMYDAWRTANDLCVCQSYQC